MRISGLTELSKSRSMIDSFGGYNHNLRISEGQFYNMENLISDYYPLLSPRKQRGIYAVPQSLDGITGLIAKDALCYVDGQYFVINQYRVDLGLNNQPKQLVSFGAYVIILPDKKYINTADFTDYGSIEATFITTGDVSFDLTRIDGTPFGDETHQMTRSATAPANPNNGDYWIDISQTPNVLKQYSVDSAMWVTIATTYIKISHTGIGTAFNTYDGITIGGIKGHVEYDDLNEIDGSFVIWDKGDDWITIVGFIDQSRTISVPVTVAKKNAAYGFRGRVENRLWGCRYGVNANNDVVNELYACKLGDFKNWYCYMGTSQDSYAASLGTDGVFTGAISYLGHPLFFKENCVHKVYGNYPANFQVQTTELRGVERGSSKSLAMVNEVLYYKGKLGICAYDGSLPTEISSAFGDEIYSDAVACSHWNKYYVSLKDKNNKYHLFVYDAQKGMWHREDNIHIDHFCSCRNELYYVDNTTGYIRTMFGSGTADTDPIHWEAETGVIGVESPDKKYISQINIRLALALGTTVTVLCQYDSIGGWEHLCTVTSRNLQAFTVPVRPRRCDHLRLKIIGYGEGKIYSYCKTIEQGSDV